jgi:hypothetical protein
MKLDMGRGSRMMMGTEKSDDVYTPMELQRLYYVSNINELKCRPAFELTHKQDPFGQYSLSKKKQKLRRTFIKDEHGLEKWYTKELECLDQFYKEESRLVKGLMKVDDRLELSSKTKKGKGEGKGNLDITGDPTKKKRRLKMYIYHNRMRDICQKKLTDFCSLNTGYDSGTDQIEWIKKQPYDELSKKEIKQLTMLGYTNPTKKTGEWVEAPEKNIIRKGTEICLENKFCMDYVPRIPDIPRDTMTIYKHAKDAIFAPIDSWYKDSVETLKELRTDKYGNYVPSKREMRLEQQKQNRDKAKKLDYEKGTLKRQEKKEKRESKKEDKKDEKLIKKLGKLKNTEEAQQKTRDSITKRRGNRNTASKASTHKLNKISAQKSKLGSTSTFQHRKKQAGVVGKATLTGAKAVGRGTVAVLTKMSTPIDSAYSAGRAIKSASRKVKYSARAVKDATASGIKRGASATASGIERGARATASGIARGASATGRGFKAVGMGTVAAFQSDKSPLEVVAAAGLKGLKATGSSIASTTAYKVLSKSRREAKAKTRALIEKKLAAENASKAYIDAQKEVAKNPNIRNNHNIRNNLNTLRQKRDITKDEYSKVSNFAPKLNLEMSARKDVKVYERLANRSSNTATKNKFTGLKTAAQERVNKYVVASKLVKLQKKRNNATKKRNNAAKKKK